MAAPAAYRPARQPACLHCRQSLIRRRVGQQRDAAARKLGEDSVPVVDAGAPRRKVRCGAVSAVTRRTPALRYQRRRIVGISGAFSSGRPAQYQLVEDQDPTANQPRRQPPPAPASRAPYVDQLAHRLCTPAITVDCGAVTHGDTASSMLGGVPTARLRRTTPPRHRRGTGDRRHRLRSSAGDVPHLRLTSCTTTAAADRRWPIHGAGHSVYAVAANATCIAASLNSISAVRPPGRRHRLGDRRRTPAAINGSSSAAVRRTPIRSSADGAHRCLRPLPGR